MLDTLERNTQIKDLVRQSFDIFNTFGKDPDAVENLIFGFVSGLENMDVRDISEAFKEWLKTSSVMPTPANVRAFAIEARKMRESLSSRDGRKALPAPRPAPRSMHSWVYKNWGDFTAEDKINLGSHLATLNPKNRRDYLLYLKNSWGVPAAQFHQLDQV